MIFLFYILFLIVLGVILVLSLSQPQHNLITWQVVILACGMEMLLLFGGAFAKKSESRMSKKVLRRVTVFSLAAICAGLFFVGCIARNQPESLVDYGYLYHGAIGLAEGEQINNPYFGIYSNNIIPMIFLSRIIVLSKALRLADPYYLINLTGAFISVIAIGAAVYLLEGKERYHGSRLLLIALFVAFLPLWIISPTLYTDQMSFGTAVLSLALLKAVGTCRTKLGRIICCIGSGGYWQ